MYSRRQRYRDVCDDMVCETRGTRWLHWFVGWSECLIVFWKTAQHTCSAHTMCSINDCGPLPGLAKHAAMKAMIKEREMRDIIYDSTEVPTPEVSIWNCMFFSGHLPPPPTPYIFMDPMFWCVKDFQLCPASRWISFCFISSTWYTGSRVTAQKNDGTLSSSRRLLPFVCAWLGWKPWKMLSF